MDFQQRKFKFLEDQIQREHPGTPATPRHVAVRYDGDHLTVFFSRVDENEIDPEAPERIHVTRIRLASDWNAWKAGPIEDVLTPELPYEGIEFAPVSRGGAQVNVRQLRDPAYFRDEDGREYLLYSVAGEMGLAIAEISR